jgi:hypothetical protein
MDAENIDIQNLEPIKVGPWPMPFTQRDFEIEKTKRIKALAKTLIALANIEPRQNAYGTMGMDIREQVLNNLSLECSKCWI